MSDQPKIVIATTPTIPAPVYASAEKFPCPSCAKTGTKSYLKLTDAIESKELAIGDWFTCKVCGQAIEILKFEQRWMVFAQIAVAKAGEGTPTETEYAKEAEIVCPVCGLATYDLVTHQQGKAAVAATDETPEVPAVAPTCPGKRAERKLDVVKVEVECNLCKQKTFDLPQHQTRDAAGKLLICPGVPRTEAIEAVEVECPDCGALTYDLDRHKTLSCFGKPKR